MLRNIVIFFAVLIGAIVFLHTSLDNGSLMKYLDEHPDPRWVPAADYYIGQGYYLFHDLDQATTFFMRVPEKYPDSSYSEEAFFNYLECLDDMVSVPRDVLIVENQKYIDRYPNGKHIEMIQNRIDSLKMNTH